MIKLVVFDLWNTLIRSSKGSLPSIVKKELGIEDMDARVFTTNYDNAFCLKVSSIGDALDDLCARCGIDVPAEKKQVVRRTIQRLRESVEPFPDALPVLRKLKGKYTVAILSNTSEPALKYALRSVPILDYVDAIVASCEEGLVKPDSRLFASVLRRFRVDPKEAVMVGDNLYNDILGAKSVGMHAILLDRSDETEYPDKIDSLGQLPEYLEKL